MLAGLLKKASHPCGLSRYGRPKQTDKDSPLALPTYTLPTAGIQNRHLRHHPHPAALAGGKKKEKKRKTEEKGEGGRLRAQCAHAYPCPSTYILHTYSPPRGLDGGLSRTCSRSYVGTICCRVQGAWGSQIAMPTATRYQYLLPT